MVQRPSDFFLQAELWGAALATTKRSRRQQAKKKRRGSFILANSHLLPSRGVAATW